MPLRRLLCSAERLSERAIRRALVDLKTFGWRSSALLRRVTRADQRRAFPRAGVVHGLHQDVVGGKDVAAVHLLDEEAGEAGQQAGDRASPASGVALLFSRCRSRRGERRLSRDRRRSVR